MRIGLIDVDGHGFPNLALMKISAYHKNNGDDVEWYDPLQHGFPLDPMDIVYVSKVFSDTYSEHYPYYINAKQIIYGGSGYCIKIVDGEEVYNNSFNTMLPREIEHVYPDYSIYYDKVPETRNTAYGFLTRGCPRGCLFCIVGKKEGRCSKKVADLNEFWDGQPNIELLDPNMFVCKDWRKLAQQLIDSKAYINFNQGVDIRTMTKEKANYIKKMKIKSIHFAWDKYEDKEKILPKLKLFKEICGFDKRKQIVYVLTNFNTTHEQDLERIYTLRDLGYWPYVMIYNKQSLPKKHITRKLQRWVNMRAVFESTPNFNDYRG